MKLRFAVFMLVVFVIGCQGDRWSSFADRASVDGRWRIDGVLIRSYNISLEEAANAIHTLIEDQKWFLLGDDRSERRAKIRVKTRELVRVEFHIWAPANKATEIGIQYAGGNRPGAIRLFTDLEKLIPNRRITVNQPGESSQEISDGDQE